MLPHQRLGQELPSEPPTPVTSASIGVMKVTKDTFVAVVLARSQYMPTNAKAEPTMPRYNIASTGTTVKLNTGLSWVTNPIDINAIVPTSD